MEKMPLTRRIVVELTHPIIADGPIDKWLTESKLLNWGRLEARFPHSLKAERIFTSVSAASLQEMVNSAKKQDAGFQPLLETAPGRMVNLLACFFIRMLTDVDPVELIRALYENPAVRLAYPDPDITVASVGIDPNFGQQEYLHEAPTGIGVKAAWPNPAGGGERGGDGEGAGFIDIEYGWVLGENELLDSNGNPRVSLIGNPPGHNSQNPTLYTHGTQTLAIIMALDNNQDVNGIVPHVTDANVVSVLDPHGVENRHDAIAYAARKLAKGDVLVLPLQTYGEGLPLESTELEFAAIRLATALGITVVEAAGNAGKPAGDLDAFNIPPNLPGRRLLKRGHPGFEDSNAVMVGASQRKRGNRRYKRYPASNYGSRVDCFAWGEDVITLGSSVHNGTSAACSIVAGAALVLQGIMRTRGSSGLDPIQLRQKLTAGGTPSARNQKIGVMPNLGAIIPELP